jgi:hypothetical protein
LPLNLGSGFLERGHPLGYMIVNFCDVESEGGAEHGTNLARSQREHDRVKLRHHLATREPSEIAAAAWTIRRFVRNRLEISTCLDSFFDNSNGSQRGFLGCIFIHILDYMRGANRFRDRHILAMLPIIINHVLVPWRRDAPGMPNCQALDAELQLNLRWVSTRFLDYFGGNGFGVGKSCLAQQNPFDNVIAGPFLGTRIDGGRMFRRHRFRQAKTKGADLFANDRIFDQFVVN